MGLFWPLLVNAEWVTAKYAGEFLRTGIGARPLSLGGAGISIVRDVTSLYWNPAALPFMENLQIHGMHSERFSGLVNRDFLGVGLGVKDGLALAFGIYRLGVDGIPVTRLLDPNRDLGEIYVDENGNLVQNVPTVVKTVNDAEWAFTVAFGRKASERLHYGGTIRVIRKTVGEYGAWGLGFDAGIWWNPIRRLEIGSVLMDATSTWIAWDSQRKERILPHWKIGMAYPFEISFFTITPAIDLHLSFENLGSSAQIAWGKAEIETHGGIEVLVQKRIAVRIGLDRGRFTAGAGFEISAFSFDYCFANHIDLGVSHHVSVTLNWDKSRLLRL